MTCCVQTNKPTSNMHWWTFYGVLPWFKFEQFAHWTHTSLTSRCYGRSQRSTLIEHLFLLITQLARIHRCCWCCCDSGIYNDHKEEIYKNIWIIANLKYMKWPIKCDTHHSTYHRLSICLGRWHAHSKIHFQKKLFAERNKRRCGLYCETL